MCGSSPLADAVTRSTGMGSGLVTPAAASNADVRTISRGDYARFVAETSRASAECGRNGLFGGKRDWKTVGNEGSPVVCVSAADAQAYAAWLSGRSPHLGARRPAIEQRRRHAGRRGTLRPAIHRGIPAQAPRP